MNALPTTASMRLLVSAQVDLLGGEVIRGMPVLAEDGNMVGAVAAAVQTGAARIITHVLLGQVPPTAEYRLIPLGTIGRLEGECVYLRISGQLVAALPIYQPDC